MRWKKSYKGKTRYIQYSENNDEPEDHVEAKARSRQVLSDSGYELITNTDKFEFKLPELYNEIGDMKRNYDLDVLMYNRERKHLVIVEVNGAYHFATPHKAAATALKSEIVISFFNKYDNLKVKDKEYPYDSFVYHGIRTEDLLEMSLEELKIKLVG